MLREMLQGKLHQARVTDCQLGYPGSLTVDLDLIERSGMLPYQKVQVVDLENGARLETYLIPGRRGERDVIVNGAAARLIYRGDRIIVIAYATYAEEELRDHRPRVLVLDERNEVVSEQ